jgi:hypothetical protein
VARYFTGPRSASTVRRFALYSGFLDLQVGEDLRLDSELVDEAGAVGLPSFVVRGAEL